MEDGTGVVPGAGVDKGGVEGPSGRRRDRQGFGLVDNGFAAGDECERTVCGVSWRGGGHVVDGGQDDRGQHLVGNGGGRRGFPAGRRVGRLLRATGGEGRVGGQRGRVRPLRGGGFVERVSCRIRCGKGPDFRRERIGGAGGAAGSGGRMRKRTDGRFAAGGHGVGRRASGFRFPVVCGARVEGDLFRGIGGGVD